MSQQSVKQTIEDDLESQELSQHIQNELDDGVRIQIAQELKSKIEQKIKAQKSKAPVVYNKRMLDESEELKLLRTANKILQENSIPKGLDIVEMGQTLLYMLMGRSKRNIGQAELDFIEKSGSIDDFQGFFKD